MNVHICQYDSKQAKYVLIIKVPFTISLRHQVIIAQDYYDSICDKVQVNFQKTKYTQDNLMIEMNEKKKTLLSKSGFCSRKNWQSGKLTDI